MKKVISLLCIGMSFCFIGKAQMFNPGDKVLNLGMGVGKTWNKTQGSQMGIPQLSASFDYGLRDDLGPGTIGIGAVLSYESRKKNENVDTQWKGHRFIIAPKGTYHYSFTDKLDTYGTLALGVGINQFNNSGNPNSPIYSPKDNSVSFIARISVGAKYNFTEHFGAFAEVGYGISILVFGASLGF